MTWRRPRRSERDFEAQLDDELKFHIEKLAEEKIAAGVSPAEARRQAVLKFGGVEQFKEELRYVHRSRFFESLRSNLRGAIRRAWNAPSFSFTIIATLALGIGANTAVFSAVDAILLRPLPFPEGDRLMQLGQYDPKVRNSETHVAPVRLEDWNRMNSTFEAITGYYTEDVSEISGALPEKLTHALVAPRFFDVWGVLPALGRAFVPEEERAGGRSAAVISDRLWRSRFAAGPDVIGKVLRVGRVAYSIVGVMPASFLFPERDVDFWTPVPVDSPIAQDRRSTWYSVIGRLKPGVTPARAQSDLVTVQAQLGKAYPKTDGRLTVRVRGLKNVTVQSVVESLWILFGAVTVLLLIACTNIGALLLARTTERQREIAIRYSLGASRASIVMQLLTEVFVLALAGSAAALAVAAEASHIFAVLAKDLPRVEEIGLDGRLVVYTLLCATTATLLCGFFPAIQATRRTLGETLAQGGRTQVRGRNPLQWILVGVQVALAVTLLVGAGLLLRSFQALARVSPGFDVEHVLTLRVSANWGETVDLKGLRQRMDRDLDAVRQIPGVEGAATSLSLPGVPFASPGEFRVVEGPAEPDRRILAANHVVSAGYFATMRIPMLAGEPCRDTLAGGAVVNRSFVESYLGGRPAIGNHVEFVPPNPYMQPVEIRGIAGDAREDGIQHEPGPIVYFCNSAPVPSPVFLIRTRSEPMALAGPVRRKLHEVEPARSVYEIMPLARRLSDAMAENRMRTTLLAFFALTAVTLACVGLYGTLSYVVGIRRREVGLRLAIGAERGWIVRQFLREALRASLLGCLAGLGLAAMFSRILNGMLYGVSALDKVTFGAVALLVLLTAALSAWMPAARASRLDPMQVLREE